MRSYLPVFDFLSRAILVVALAGAALLSGQCLASTASPDAPHLLLLNARVYTMNENRPVAEAIAIRGNRILAVGSGETLRATASSETRVVDLDGKAVLPGFQDQHVHPMGAGLEKQGCQIEQGANLATLLRQLGVCVAQQPAGSWVTGGPWDASALGVVPEASLLDPIAPDHPVYLIDTSGHSVWVNSAALAQAGLSASTINPRGGIIERDAEGYPSGVLRESATALVSKEIPPPSTEELEDALGDSLELMLSFGITSYTDAATGYLAGAQRELEVYRALADAGKIPQRARVCVTWSPAAGVKEAGIDELIARSNLYSGHKVTVDCVKIFLDGVPADGHTAAMLEPYAGVVSGRSDPASQRGLLLLEQNELNRAVARFDAMGLAVKFHAAGDAAVRAGLDAIEYAREHNGYTGKLHDVGHSTFVNPEDLSRGRAIGATFELSPYLWAPSPINDDISKAVGSPRIERVWPFRELLDNGASVVVGSDWAVVPSVNPWIAVEMLVTRQRSGGSPDSFGARQAITLQEALELFTVSPARHMGAQHKLGQLAPGMLADLIVVDRDPFAIPVTQLHDVRVVMTIVDGQLVFER